ncbi:Fic/DOC family protein [Vibrio anguillarum]|uniref:Fic/DOC family protein n=1 Tax=Vibrio anguillarum TaxID=55601 RepID=UPI00097E2BF9|nr:Fic family protein [Vibrio anguillarum]AQM19541.1 cell filamentation protein Fic [Vibrio anguillarum]AUB87939.1 cell filamentation protein Fic [Vibrio anguillarum]AUB91381.1 cell filamentation protein Fic [Vibrio anguillarum]AUB94820.1 cell filamentation protein Fic [Vibrio anguillarum]AUB98239.1 cell filamentation protein Fic [Vibrio anguillarum]
MNRYVLDSSETRFEVGSQGKVLANKLGITISDEMDDVEAILLTKLYEKIFEEGNTEFQPTFSDIIGWHRQWLGNIYEWAGRIRNVDMGKGGFQFASPLQIGRCIELFEQNYLSKFESIPEMGKEEFVSYLARSHIEFILIHPFREGNGRISRLLMDVMCNKAGLGLLDYSLWDKHKDFYIASIQAGVAHEFQHMERLVRDTIS